MTSYVSAGTPDTPVLMPLGNAMSYILLYPAGSVTGTTGDLAAFAQAFVNDDCPLFEKQETLDELLTETAFYGDNKTVRNCHGFWPEMYAVTAYGHGGNTNGYSANLMFDPVSKTGVVVTTNMMGEGTFCYGIPEVVLGDPKEHPAFAGSEITERNDITGYYVSVRGISKGFAKIINALSLFAAAATEDEDVYDVLGMATLTRIANDAYLFEDGSQTLLMYADKTSDGSGLLQIASADYIIDNALMLKFCWCILMLIFAVIYLVVLIVKLIRKLIKKVKYDTAAKAATLGQIAVAASILAVALLIFVIGFVKAAMTIVAVLVILCMLAMAASAIVVLKEVFTSKEMKVYAKVRHIITVLVVLLTIAFMLFFQLYDFWTM